MDEKEKKAAEEFPSEREAGKEPGRLERLREKARRLPLTPGVYIMRDSRKNIIYIGKAKALKNRVSQYFGSPKNHPEKVRQMVARVEDFEYILCDSEFEALILECSLIKQHMPKYNILLKDSKGYHYVKVTKGDWPAIQAVKMIEDDGADYIGPYNSSWAVTETVDEALKIFKLPQPACNKVFPRDIGKGRPCLNFFIGACCAPCSGKVKQSEYRETVKEAVDFIKGGRAVSLDDLRRRMEEAAEKLDFERAARLRDRLRAIERMRQKQKVVTSTYQRQDVVALAQSPTAACFEVFVFRQGRLADREQFLLEQIADAASARAEFLQRYYSMDREVPPRIALDGDYEDKELLTRWLSEKAGRRVQLAVPQKGEQYDLVQMCRSNAAEYLAQHAGRTGRETAALDELARLLGLQRPPQYIEAYDISNTAGSENVAGMVVFADGRPYKPAYRKFKIKGFEGQDDYRSMAEVLERRFAEYEKAREAGEEEGFGRLPDLILLDGGQGQVNAVLPVLRKAGIEVPLFGMVKDGKHRTRAIAAGGGDIAIKSTRRAYTLIATIQEEVHRFAIGYHRQRRSRQGIATTLTEIPGVGPARAKLLFRQFKTLKAISDATEEELAGLEGMTRPAAAAVYRHFHPEEKE
ncbi:MAG TPA: excinuclease ABC subunit UvrC [Firmicutes bacterium]|nr:excinuclease ABC subunit UvrC [Bacillota bacterium]